MLIACFVHERKHRMVKRYCADILNTIVFETSVLSEVLAWNGAFFFGSTRARYAFISYLYRYMHGGYNVLACVNAQYIIRAMF